LKKACSLALFLLIILSAAQFSPAYLDQSLRNKITRFNNPVLIANQLPQGYVLKKVQLNKHDTLLNYQIDYHCYCAGQNFSISILGNKKTFDLALADKIEKVPTPLGPLTLGAYPAVPKKGIKKPFQMTHWFGTGQMRHTVITGLTGNPAPDKDMMYLLKHLEYFDATDQ